MPSSALLSVCLLTTNCLLVDVDKFFFFARCLFTFSKIYGLFHDSGKGLCVTQLAELLIAHLSLRPLPYLPHAFTT